MRPNIKKSEWELKLVPLVQEVEAEIKKAIPSFGPKTVLRDAIEYALMGQGKRFRPVLLLLTATSLNPNANAMSAALAVEFFHTASLLADDLPCMDNDPMRRDHPSCHIKFNEATALLASFALISSGYTRIASSREAVEIASSTTGTLGACYGQYLDLFPPQMNQAFIMEVIEKKTVSLFELSMALGWIFGGGKLSSLLTVKKAARDFGIAFQIADDFQDLEQDRKERNSMNLVHFVGLKKGTELLHYHVNEFLAGLDQLKLSDSLLTDIAQSLVIQGIGTADSPH